MRTYSVCTGHEGRPVSEPRPFRSEELDAAFTAAVAKCRVLTMATAGYIETWDEYEAFTEWRAFGRFLSDRAGAPCYLSK